MDSRTTTAALAFFCGAVPVLVGLLEAEPLVLVKAVALGVLLTLGFVYVRVRRGER